MTREQWEIVRANAAAAATGTLEEAQASLRGCQLAERTARDTLEVASKRLQWGPASIHRSVHAAARTAREAHEAAWAAMIAAEQLVRAHAVSQTPWEDRDCWWGWCAIDGDSWAAVRRFVK